MTAAVEAHVDSPVDESVIVFCPVCCTPVDVAASDRDIMCPVCTQQWTMVIDLDRIANHSPALCGGLFCGYVR